MQINLNNGAENRRDRVKTGSAAQGKAVRAGEEGRSVAGASSRAANLAEPSSL